MNLEKGKNYFGFRLEKEEKLDEINSVGQLFIHEKSGAKLLHIENEDDNKVFSISFRTPPEDSTGLPHILEHSVLCGSRKFPVKDPFIELAKGSLNTYLNAMTFSDKTMYPVASRNDKDFKNLVDVYMDAVLYPNIYEQDKILKQEGWHYELNDEKEDIIYKGVVYNEMKGAFSSPEQILFRKIQQSLFPDTPYAMESGGDPDVIPKLTQGQFLNFHKKYYHPSNSYIYLYGNMDIQEYLQWLDKEYLHEFDVADMDSSIPIQKPFAGTEEIVEEYSISSNEKEADKTYLSYNTVIGLGTDPEIYYAFEILEYLLLETPGAPLKKALLDANIGKDVFGSFDNGILQPTFSVVVKNGNPEQKEKFKKVIYDTLKELVDKGIDKKLIQASINILEFRLREADFGRRPKGLTYNILSMSSWLYDEDPMIHLQYNKPFEKIKSALTANYFEDLIKKYILDNPHSTFVMIKPKKGLAKEKEEALKQELKAYKEGLSKEEIQNLIKETVELKEYQGSPNNKEDVEKIPLLSLDDIKQNADELPLLEKEEQGVKVLTHSIFTNKITYVNFFFDTTNVPQMLIPYLGFLTRVMGKVSTENYEYQDLFNEINIHTGGIDFGISIFGENQNAENYHPKLVVRSKAFTKQVSKLLELIQEIILRTKLTETNRLKEIIAETKSRLEMGIMSSGHMVAANRAESYFSPIAYYQELTKGIMYYQFIADLDKNFDGKVDELKSNLQKVIDLVFNKNNLLVSISGEEEEYQAFQQSFSSFAEGLRNESVEKQAYQFELSPKNEGILTSGKIQYVAKSYNFIKLGYEYKGYLQVLQTVASLDYLWHRVRVSGGAYGCTAHFAKNGNLYFTSYRDPNLKQTLQAYDEMQNYVKGFQVEQREMTKYIIGTMSRIDFPLTPSMVGERAIANYISKVTQEDIQREREEILNTTPEDIQSMSDLLKDAMAQNYICVLGNENKIRENKDLFKELIDIFE